MRVLRAVEEAIQPEFVVFTIFIDKFVTNNGWKASDVKRVSDILKRDRVIYEPKGSYIKNESLK